MKTYTRPEIEIEQIKYEDVISTSLGTETSTQDSGDGVWDIIVD